MRSLSTMIAPSILASSRSPVAVNGTSRVKPPVEIDSTVLSWPSTISAPVRPRRIRSSPSRSEVPGAIDAKRARRSAERLSSRSLGMPATAGSLGSLTGQVRIGRPSASSRSAWSTRRAARRAEAMSGTSMHPHAVDGARRPGATRRLARARRAPPPPRSRAAPPRRSAAAGRGPGAARRPGRSRPSPPRPCGAGCVASGRGEGHRDGQVAGRLDDPRAADGRGEHVVGVQPDAAVLLQHGEHHRDPGAVEPGRRTPGALGRRRGHQRLHLGEQRPAALHRDRDAGAGHLAAVVLDEQAGRVGDRGDALAGQVEAADLVDRDRSGSSSPAPSGTGSCGRPRSAAPRRRRARAPAGRRSSRPW